MEEYKPDLVEGLYLFAAKMWNYSNGTNNVCLNSNAIWNSIGNAVQANSTTGNGWRVAFGTNQDNFNITKLSGATGEGTNFSTATNLLLLDNGGNLSVTGGVTMSGS